MKTSNPNLIEFAILWNPENNPFFSFEYKKQRHLIAAWMVEGWTDNFPQIEISFGQIGLQLTPSIEDAPRILDHLGHGCRTWVTYQLTHFALGPKKTFQPTTTHCSLTSMLAQNPHTYVADANGNPNGFGGLR